jgi:hypothetical protein
VKGAANENPKFTSLKYKNLTVRVAIPYVGLKELLLS